MDTFIYSVTARIANTIPICTITIRMSITTNTTRIMRTAKSGQNSKPSSGSGHGADPTGR